MHREILYKRVRYSPFLNFLDGAEIFGIYRSVSIIFVNGEEQMLIFGGRVGFPDFFLYHFESFCKFQIGLKMLGHFQSVPVT